MVPPLIVISVDNMYFGPGTACYDDEGVGRKVVGVSDSAT